MKPTPEPGDGMAMEPVRRLKLTPRQLAEMLRCKKDLINALLKRRNLRVVASTYLMAGLSAEELACLSVSVWLMGTFDLPLKLASMMHEQARDKLQRRTYGRRVVLVFTRIKNGFQFQFGIGTGRLIVDEKIRKDTLLVDLTMAASIIEASMWEDRPRLPHPREIVVNG